MLVRNHTPHSTRSLTHPTGTSPYRRLQPVHPPSHTARALADRQHRSFTHPPAAAARSTRPPSCQRQPPAVVSSAPPRLTSFAPPYIALRPGNLCHVRSRVRPPFDSLHEELTLLCGHRPLSPCPSSKRTIRSAISDVDGAGHATRPSLPPRSLDALIHPLPRSSHSLAALKTSRRKRQRLLPPHPALCYSFHARLRQS